MKLSYEDVIAFALSPNGPRPLTRLHLGLDPDQHAVAFIPPSTLLVRIDGARDVQAKDLSDVDPIVLAPPGTRLVFATNADYNLHKPIGIDTPGIGTSPDWESIGSALLGSEEDAAVL